MAETALKNMLDPGTYRCTWTLSKPPDTWSWEVAGDAGAAGPMATARRRLRQGSSRLGRFPQWSRPDHSVATAFRIPNRLRGIGRWT